MGIELSTSTEKKSGRLMEHELSNKDIEGLNEKARNLRIEILQMLTVSGSGHTGGSLSAADIVTVLYFHTLRHDPGNPQWKDRDRFILSKGHAAPVLYGALALSGYFDKEILRTLRKVGSPLQGHPCSCKLPGIEISTGSLGQGLSIANGIAMGIKMDGLPSRVYCLLGDGEIQEGQVWEAAMTAAHYKLDNLCAIIDNNGLQIDGHCCDVMHIEPIVNKWEAFGWHVIDIDGHDIRAISDAFQMAESLKGKPTMIVARTIKGKGVSFFEGKVEYHGLAPTSDELTSALKELQR
jgi:transketolase